MQIELKNIKYAAFLSQETAAYSATLYVDGKKLGTVENAGHGGCDDFHGDYKEYAKVDTWCKANLPKWKVQTGEFSDDPNMKTHEGETGLEMHCSDLLQDFLTTRDLKKHLRKAVLFVENKSIQCIGWKGLRVVTQRHIDHVAQKQKKILNNMPLPEALALWKKYG